MRTIVEPKEHIDKLWGKQQIRERDTYRMMRYVLRVDHDSKVLLHNVVTGQLVVLNHDEADVLSTLPKQYSPVMEQLIYGHFLVPNQYDEHQQVVNIRLILRKLESVQQRSGFQHYVILPTTACNARCYYCFEQGVKPITMTEETANDVVDFIADQCREKPVSIMWFGGEPTVAFARIDQISKGLKDKGVHYSSTMISNAYLFDEEMVRKAKNLWNLKSIQISVDGTENNYNEVKNYVHASESPYKRVMRNIEMLLESGIHVDLRMNFDLHNYTDFENLVKEASSRYRDKTNLQVYAYPVIGEYPDKDGKVKHGDDHWRSKAIVALNDIVRKAGLYRPKLELPSLKHSGCGADDDLAVTINPQGILVKCPEQFEEKEKIGTVKDGITNKSMVYAWKEIADCERCRECAFFPRCMRPKKCSAGNSCYFQDRNQQFLEAVKRKFAAWELNQT